MIDGLLAWSYDASGMAVTQVTREPCILGTAGDCYVVYMQRADLHRLSVFVPVTPGSSVTYSVTTDAMRNAVPPTITRKGAFATYTLDGTPSAPPAFGGGRSTTWLSKWDTLGQLRGAIAPIRGATRRGAAIVGLRGGQLCDCGV